MALENVDREHFLTLLVAAFERTQRRMPDDAEMALLLDMVENHTPEFAEALSAVSPSFDIEISICEGKASFQLVPKAGDNGDQIAFAM